MTRHYYYDKPYDDVNIKIQKRPSRTFREASTPSCKVEIQQNDDAASW